MTETTLYALAACALIGLGVFGLVARPDPLRKVLAFNIVGTGVFLLAGAIARRGAGAGFEADPVLMALLITGIVVAFSASAVAIALLVRLYAVAGDVSLAEAPPVYDDD
jgi:multicomponent Na+:H+ antiporter subunit C